VLADAELLAAADDNALSAKALLTGLLTHRYVKLLRYGDEGPPAEVCRRSCGPAEAGLTVAEGWAELLPPDGEDGRGLVYADASGPTYTGIFGQRAEFARRDTAAAIYGDLDVEQASDRRERDALAAEVAEAMQVDLFITERPYLLETRGAIAQGVTVCSPAEGLALVGLYLRSQHEFIIWKAADGSGTYSMNEGLYYQVGAVELLPEAWRWSRAWSQASQPTGIGTLRELQHSLFQRVQRSLKSRDGFHRACNLPQNNDTARTVLTELDSILVSLMGAVDSTARVAHIVLGLPGNPYGAGWQHHQTWLPKVAAQEPALGALFDVGTPPYHTLTILRLLRNTVHGEMMRATAVQRTGRPQETAIGLPGHDEAAIVSSLDALGGQAAWGVRPVANASSLVDPGLFIERLFPEVLTLLNEVMEKTPVERLSNVQLASADGQSPTDRRTGQARWYSERNRLSIRWQLGF
jgi:hypothetical protein